MTPPADTPKRYISVTDTAKLLRVALKAAFPDVKFSVRSDSYSMGASIDVRWTGGPYEGVVARVARRFQGATFDGMTDCKEYHASDLNGERVHFGADSVSCTREIPAPEHDELCRAVADRWGIPVPPANHDPIVPGAGGEWFSTLVYRELRDRGERAVLDAIEKERAEESARIRAAPAGVTPEQTERADGAARPKPTLMR
jgi:hypothetical protein